MIDVFAAALILECIHPSSWLGWVLSVKPLRALGLVSYGFYVYHDLLHDFFALFAMHYFPGAGYAGVVITALVGAVLISTLSYQLLEKPMLKLKARFTGQGSFSSDRLTHREPKPPTPLSCPLGSFSQHS